MYSAACPVQRPWVIDVSIVLQTKQINQQKFKNDTVFVPKNNNYNNKQTKKHKVIKSTHY